MHKLLVATAQIAVAAVLKAVGARPFVLGVVLWAVISTASLYVILQAV